MAIAIETLQLMHGQHRVPSISEGSPSRMVINTDDGIGHQAAEGEKHGGGARPVEPLGVVDEDQQGRLLRVGGQEREGRGADGEAVSGLGRTQGQRSLQCFPEKTAGYGRGIGAPGAAARTGPRTGCGPRSGRPAPAGRSFRWRPRRRSRGALTCPRPLRRGWPVRRSGRPGRRRGAG